MTGTFLLAERFDGIGAWSNRRSSSCSATTLLATGILDVLFNYNVKLISRRLGRGQLDHTLDPAAADLDDALLTEGFAPFSGSTVLLPGFAVMAWAWAALAPAVSSVWLARWSSTSSASAAIMLAFTYLWGSLAFWAPRGAEEINSSSIRLIDGAQAVPARRARGRRRWWACSPSCRPASSAGCRVGRCSASTDRPLRAGADAAGGGRACLRLPRWRIPKGLRHYGRAGSQRYLAFGHRRYKMADTGAEPTDTVVELTRVWKVYQQKQRSAQARRRAPEPAPPDGPTRSRRCAASA